MFSEVTPWHDVTNRRPAFPHNPNDLLVLHFKFDRSHPGSRGDTGGFSRESVVGYL